MKKVIIFGNSGSGKSTLAKKLQQQYQLSHLDLDTLAWDMTPSPVRRDLNTSHIQIQKFCDKNESWVIEGCYSDLIELISPESDQLIFMNLSVAHCIENAKNRPWESHKYESKEAQDENLEMLIDWIKGYASRTDTFSQSAHQKLYDDFHGEKQMILENS